ncbi:DinB family protein [Chengkuizengella sediminis]|uniref:DinB family protein n=1 Tax=Chengkuizengella sediminis TaxID=1885917 RepID=UPI00138956A3|nr:DinB family protein [Chengkuizengella sediminis]NDI33274.1 DinB family protein [Chengkuizengella sediminis]
MMEFVTEIRNKLIQSVEDMNNEQINQKRTNDDWNIVQVLHHLYLTEYAIQAGFKHVIQKNKQNPTTIKSFEIVTNRTIKREAPDNIQPSDQYMSKQDILSLLSESRDQLIGILNNIEDHSLLSHLSLSHPFLGRLNLDQYLEFIGIHEQRHIKQIEDLKSSMIVS